eukprot:TRINITY_DN21265_c0_g1_i1.p1 TRINITY_DN21265_c0_g1~~TRINITY_DN21265_c0_g1_i1.p1  ORF type:complete len:419 (+),score=121.13 TRINITY_DN21265_c0_g1_i1:224-1480(+)
MLRRAQSVVLEEGRQLSERPLSALAEAAEEQKREAKARELLSSALMIAGEAVAHDSEHAYSLAAQSYHDLEQPMRDAIPFLPEELAALVAEKLRKYTARARLIQHSLKASESARGGTKRSGEPSPEPIQFTDESSTISTQYMYIPPPMPEPHYRCYWLFRVLSTTIRRGGFFSEHTYIPSSTWLQCNANLSHQLDKMSACLFVAEEVLPKINTLSFNALDAAFAQLEHIATDLQAIQEHMAETIPGVPRPRQTERSAMRDKKLYVQRQNRVKESVSKIKENAGDPHCVDTMEYTNALILMMERAAPFEKWLKQSEKTNISKMMDVLEKIGGFFDSCIPWILEDVQKLLFQYQEDITESFLGGVDFQLDEVNGGDMASEAKSSGGEEGCKGESKEAQSDGGGASTEAGLSEAHKEDTRQ